MIFRACERFGLRPPHVGESWDKTNHWGQMLLTSYETIRQKEEMDLLAAQAGVEQTKRMM